MLSLELDKTELLLLEDELEHDDKEELDVELLQEELELQLEQLLLEQEQLQLQEDDELEEHCKVD